MAGRKPLNVLFVDYAGETRSLRCARRFPGIYKAAGTRCAGLKTESGAPAEQLSQSVVDWADVIAVTADVKSGLKNYRTNGKQIYVLDIPDINPCNGLDEKIARELRAFAETLPENL